MSSLEEKRPEAGAHAVSPPNSTVSETCDAPIDPKAERKLVAKLDLIIFPVFFVIYMMAFLDRINISNASIQGLTAELELDVGNRFNVCLFVSLLQCAWHSRPYSLTNPPRLTTSRTFCSRFPPT